MLKNNCHATITGTSYNLSQVKFISIALFNNEAVQSAVRDTT